MQLSVIIPTKNRDFLLEKVLKSICNQTLEQEKFEVIVVDNGSTDDTKSIAIKFEEKIKNLQYFYDKTP